MLRDVGLGSRRDRRDFERVSQLVAGGANVNEPDRYGWLAIHRAAANDRDQVIAVLVAAGSPLEARGTDAWTPLHLACVSGSARAAAALVECGADASAVAKGSNTPLHVAMVPVLEKEFGELHDDSVRLVRSIIETLLRAGADPAAQDARGRTPASIARGKGAIELAELLEKWRTKPQDTQR